MAQNAPILGGAPEIGVEPVSDNAALVQRRDSRLNQSRDRAVPAKVKAAIELMETITGPVDLETVAKAVGYPSARRMRADMTKPQSVAYIRTWRRTLVQSLSLQNPVALAHIRDSSDNDMARVQAVRTLEAMLADELKATGGQPSAIPAGFLIVVNGGPDPGAKSDDVVSYGPRDRGRRDLVKEAPNHG